MRHVDFVVVGCMSLGEFCGARDVVDAGVSGYAVLGLVTLRWLASSRCC